MTLAPRTIEDARASFRALAMLWSANPLDIALYDRMQDARIELWAAAKEQDENEQEDPAQ